MKKRWILGALVWVGLGVTSPQAQEIDVTVDGQEINFTHQAPTIENGRVLIPLRGVFEEMGATVVWHSDTGTITATRGSDDVRLKIGSRAATVNGIKHTLDAAPRIQDARTLVPLRFISESLQASVQWKSDEREVLVSSSGGDNLQPEPDNGGRQVGILREAQPGIYMQGSYQLENDRGDLKVLLEPARSDVDLASYLGDRVRVEGATESTVEGDMTLIRVESVERI